MLAANSTTFQKHILYKNRWFINFFFFFKGSLYPLPQNAHKALISETLLITHLKLIKQFSSTKSQNWLNQIKSRFSLYSGIKTLHRWRSLNTIMSTSYLDWPLQTLKSELLNLQKALMFLPLSDTFKKGTNFH